MSPAGLSPASSTMNLTGLARRATAVSLLRKHRSIAVSSSDRTNRSRPITPPPNIKRAAG
ncbi:MAG: hypothetical protein EOO65_04695 [Methanosarcinales archaeon]|nr:MAG: hypothetical protein EOO65_04695 [Methanosarcinales archaeon]